MKIRSEKQGKIYKRKDDHKRRDTNNNDPKKCKLKQDDVLFFVHQNEKIF